MAAQYRLGSMLGKGAFGEVFKAKDTSRGRTVAVKKLKLQSSNQVRAASKELKPLSALGQNPHEHILQFLGHYFENNNLCLVLEYCPQGTLNDLLLRQSFNETIELRLMAEIAAGVNFLHINNIVHRDLKLDNILIAGSKETPVAKVGDFGLAKICGQGEESVLLSNNSNYYMFTGCGTPFFMAPEILIGNRYTCKCDVFSMGAIFVAMVERKTFRTASSEKVVAFVRSEIGPIPIGDAQNRFMTFSLEEKILQGPVGRPFKDLCLSMLNKHYNDRPSARRVLEKIKLVQHLVPRNSQVTHTPQMRPVPNTPQMRPVPNTPQMRPVPHMRPVPNTPQMRPVPNTPQNNPKPHTPRQATRRRPQPVIVLGAVGAGAMIGYRYGGPWGAVGGAILGLAVGIFFG